MNVLDEYASWTDSVAQYPITAENQYLALGIADEVGELVDVLMGAAGAIDPGNVLKESGDCCWYIARYCYRTLDVKFSHIAELAANFSMAPSFPQVIKSVGIICGVEKKRVRDGASWDAAKCMQKNREAFTNVVVLLAFIINILRHRGYHLTDAVILNKGKLNTRLATGTIKGDGDNR